MKKLIDPPIQAVLLLSALALLAVTIWSLLSLRMLDEKQADAASSVNVQIPDAGMLDAPNLNDYPQMVQAPLFWDSRKAIEPPSVEVAQPVVVPVDTTLPEGRLIGIIDLGGSLFAIMQNALGNSVHLHQDDMWGAWKVAGIDPDRLILKLGDQEQSIPLVGDFAAPQENPQVAQARQVREQQQLQARQQATQPLQQAAPPPPPQSAGLPFPADTAKQPPALSVKDALEARQRLMAARWGALGGSDEETPKLAAPNAAGQAQ